MIVFLREYQRRRFCCCDKNLLKMKFTIYQALILLIGMSLYPVTVECREELTTQNVTEYDRSFQKVLSRRKRFLVYRPGSNVLVSMNIFILRDD